MSDQPPLPGEGLLGWLGRQVGYVRAAVKADVTTPPGPVPPEAPEQVIYREERVEQAPHPTEPGVTLRRTVVDEAVVQKTPPLHTHSAASETPDRP